MFRTLLEMNMLCSLYPTLLNFSGNSLIIPEGNVKQLAFVKPELMYLAVNLGSEVFPITPISPNYLNFSHPCIFA